MFKVFPKAPAVMQIISLYIDSDVFVLKYHNQGNNRGFI